jgi:aminopeptidase
MFDADKLAELATEYCVQVSEGKKIRILGNVVATPLIGQLYKHILLNGGHPIPELKSDEFEELLFTYGSKEQIAFVSPSDEVLVSEVDAVIEIFAETNTRRLSTVDPVKLKQHVASRRKLTDIFVKRLLRAGTYTVLPYPTHAFAQDAEMGLLEYENFVAKACLLDKKNPVKEWRQISTAQIKVARKLNKAKTMRFVGEDTDLSISVEGRTWVNCDGHANMPDGEIFTSPIENSARGRIRFTYPGIYVRMAREVENIALTFKNGKVVKAEAEKGKDFLGKILKTDAGAARIGEISFGTNTGITKFTKNMLFDEKMGHCIHLAVGFSPLSKETGGKNKSAIHWDLLKDMRAGEVYADNEIIYEKGRFTI